MSVYTSKAFWDDTFDRVVSSAAQGFLTGAGLGAVGQATDVVASVSLLQLKAGGLAALSMGVLTVAKCLIAGRVNPASGASFAKAVQLRPEQDMVKPRRRRAPKKRA